MYDVVDDIVDGPVNVDVNEVVNNAVNSVINDVSDEVGTEFVAEVDNNVVRGTDFDAFEDEADQNVDTVEAVEGSN